MADPSELIDERTPAGTRAPAQPTAQLRLRIEQIDGFEFRVHFDDERWHDLVLDEPAPLGRAAGPNPSRLLGAAVADCLCASFLFCLRKAQVAVGPIDADVVIETSRNERHRLRVSRIRVTLHPTVEPSEEAIAKCTREFEDFCIVTQAVREGIPIEVDIQPIFEGLEGPTA